MIFLLTNPSAQGNLIAGFLDAESAPADSPNYVIADEVPIPSELQEYASNWEEAIKSSLAGFFILSSSRTASLVSIESWQACLDFNCEETNGLTYYKSGVKSFLPPEFLSFFETNFITVKTPHLFQWHEAVDQAASLEAAMTSEINKCLLCGVSFTPVFAALNNLLTNLEANFDTPNEAVEAMSGGLPGLATYLGHSWPPVH